MKKLIYGIAAVAVGFTVITACNKGELGGPNGSLKASAYKVDINQPDTLLLNGAKPTDSVRWSVSPAGFDSIITKNNVALVFFKKAGNYCVMATDPPMTPATASITVTDSVYHPVTNYYYLPLTGDQITLVPHYNSNAGADTSYLSFVAQTRNSYCGSSRLYMADSLTNTGYGINFIYVIQPSPCTIGQSPVAAVINFTQTPAATLANGTYPLSVTLNNITYAGSVVETSSGITFNWNYTSGVLISPKEISR